MTSGTSDDLAANECQLNEFPQSNKVQIVEDHISGRAKCQTNRGKNDFVLAQQQAPDIGPIP